ncbi:hypothetical protein HN836_00510, partial [Candidatus Woesearchaeota archaeon]|nr:hypothetical protein [Candidatus Woesearchaeota archaeon]
MNLLDWAEDYFRHRDLILCQIETIVKNKDNLIIRHNDGIVKKIYITDYINNFDFSLDGDVN